MSNGKSYDYVIVGAGSAGCTLANRLTEDPDTQVLVIEAGGSDRSPIITVPLGWGKILFERLYDWGYFTEEEGEFNNRKVECARGKVLGGSSSINAMAYVRCHREDYDRWSRNGCTGWSYADILPYFIKSEDWEKGDQPLRGTGGPLTTRPANRRAIRVPPITTATRTKGSAPCNRPSATAGAAARRSPICAPP